MNGWVMSDIEACQIMYDACRSRGLPGGYLIPTFAAIGVAESGLNIHKHRLNDYDPNSPSYLSIDWGWLQINDFWNDFTLADCRRMFDPHECAVAALNIFISVKPWGAGYRRWNTYVLNHHKPYMQQMLAASRSIGVPGV